MSLVEVPGNMHNHRQNWSKFYAFNVWYTLVYQSYYVIRKALCRDGVESSHSGRVFLLPNAIHKISATRLTIDFCISSLFYEVFEMSCL